MSFASALAAASLIAGVAQIVLALCAGVATDASVVYRGASIPYYGYFQTYHWWVSHSLVIPTVMGCGAALLAQFWQASRRSSARSDRLLFGLLVAGAVIACSFAPMREYMNSHGYPEHPQYWQWNYVALRPPTVNITLADTHHALAYAHYCLGYFVLIVGMIGSPLYVWRVRRKQLAGSPTFLTVINSQKALVVAYLVYAALLRSSKVSMHLQSRGTPFELKTIYKWLEQSDVYIAAMPAGLVLNL